MQDLTISFFSVELNMSLLFTSSKNVIKAQIENYRFQDGRGLDKSIQGISTYEGNPDSPFAGQLLDPAASQAEKAAFLGAFGAKLLLAFADAV